MKKEFLLYCFKKHFALAAKHPNLWNYRPIASYLGRMKTFVLSQCQSDLVNLDGRTMSLPENEFLHLMLFEHEGFVTKVVKNLVKKGNNVLVLGANIGYWTCLIAELVGESGKVFAFEPSPDNFKFLQKNVELNDYKNIVLEQKAVADKSYQTKLYLSEGGSMDHRIYDTHTDRESVNIDVVKLDEYFSGNDIVFDFIESDIQGADFAAVQGMHSLLKKSLDVNFIIEFSPEKAKEYGSNPDDFIDNFVKLEYDFYELWWHENKLIPISVGKLKEYAKNDINTNLLCLKRKFDQKSFFKTL